MKQYNFKFAIIAPIMRIGIIAVMLLFGIRLSAQETLVSGVVRDAATKQTLLGVQVKPASQASASVITDADGAFSVKTNSLSDVLIVSVPGYAVREIPLQGRTVIDVELYSSAFSSGYGMVETLSGSLRKTLGAQAQTGVSDFTVATAFSGDSEIQARLGGNVRAVSRSGVAGMGAALFMRGLNSLNAGAQPLFIVDGVVWDNQLDAASIHRGYFSNPLANIDTKDIESITILKDGNSIYGSKASNGVILIKTVRPQDMSTKIVANLSWGMNLKPALPQMMNAAQYRAYASGQVEGVYQSRNYLYPPESAILREFPFLNEKSITYHDYNNNTNWADEVYQNGWMQNYSLGVSGGDDVAMYNLSMGYATNEGVISNTSLERLHARFNSDIKLSSRLTTLVDISVGKTLRDLRDDDVNIVTSPGFIALAKAPLLSPYRFDTKGVLSRQLSDYDSMNPLYRMSNPLALTENAIGTSSRITFNLRINPYFQISKNLLAGSIFSYGLNRVKESFFIPEAGIAPVEVGLNSRYSNEVRDLTQRQGSVFSDTYLKGNIRFNADNGLNLLGGFRYMTDTYEWDLPSGYNTGNDNIKVLVDGLGYKQTVGEDRRWKSMSWYANADYDYQNKYLLSLTASADASSRFGQESGIGLAGVRWALFPAVSGAWVVSSEEFMRHLPWINLLKLRASYGWTGNDGIDVRANRSYFQTFSYVDKAVGLELANIQNKAIEWETSKKAGAGLDIHLLNERLLLSADVFDSRTENLLTQKSLKAITGLGYYWSNGGALKNTGYELSMNVKMVNTKSFQWELGGSIGHYKNEITALPDGDFYTEILGGTVMTAVGRPAGLFYGYKTKGVFATTQSAEEAGLYKLKENGERMYYGAGDVWFDDPDKNHLIAENDRQIIGDPNPDYYGNFSNRFQWKKLALDVLFSYSYGNDVYNYMRSQLESGASFYNQTLAMTNRWTTEGQVTRVPRAVYADPMGNNVFSDRWIEDGSYIRLKTVTLSYAIPLNLTYIQGITLWASANNLFTLSKYLGGDPEFSMNNGVLFQGIDAGLTPQSRSYFMGIKINL